MQLPAPFLPPLIRGVRGAAQRVGQLQNSASREARGSLGEVARARVSGPTPREACARPPWAGRGTYLRMKRSTVELLATPT